MDDWSTSAPARLAVSEPAPDRKSPVTTTLLGVRRNDLHRVATASLSHVPDDATHDVSHEASAVVAKTLPPENAESVDDSRTGRLTSEARDRIVQLQ
jgi:hypothetical protein